MRKAPRAQHITGNFKLRGRSRFRIGKVRLNQRPLRVAMESSAFFRRDSFSLRMRELRGKTAEKNKKEQT